MNHRLNPVKTGTALGAFFGVMHLIWSVVVALGWAQVVINFKLWTQMLGLHLIAQPFDLTAAVTGIIVAAIAGVVIGQIFAHVWNRAYRA